MHIVERVEVDLAFGAYTLVVGRANDNGIGLRRGRIGHWHRDEFERSIDMRQTVEKRLKGGIDGHLHRLRLTGSRASHAGVWMGMGMGMSLSGSHGGC